MSTGFYPSDFRSRLERWVLARGADGVREDLGLAEAAPLLEWSRGTSAPRGLVLALVLRRLEVWESSHRPSLRLVDAMPAGGKPVAAEPSVSQVQDGAAFRERVRRWVLAVGVPTVCRAVGVRRSTAYAWIHGAMPQPLLRQALLGHLAAWEREQALRKASSVPPARETVRLADRPVLSLHAPAPGRAGSALGGRKPRWREA